MELDKICEVECDILLTMAARYKQISYTWGPHFPYFMECMDSLFYQLNSKCNVYIDYSSLK